MFVSTWLLSECTRCCANMLSCVAHGVRHLHDTVDHRLANGLCEHLSVDRLVPLNLVSNFEHVDGGVCCRSEELSASWIAVVPFAEGRFSVFRNAQRRGCYP